MIVPLYGADDIFSEMSFVICEQFKNFEEILNPELFPALRPQTYDELQW
jgi:hypothetical protein